MKKIVVLSLVSLLSTAAFVLALPACAGTDPGASDSLSSFQAIRSAIASLKRVEAEASSARITEEQERLLLDMQASALHSVRLSAAGINQVRGGQSFCLDEVAKVASATAQSVQVFRSGKINAEQLLTLLDMQQDAAEAASLTCRALIEGNGG